MPPSNTNKRWMLAIENNIKYFNSVLYIMVTTSEFCNSFLIHTKNTYCDIRLLCCESERAKIVTSLLGNLTWNICSVQIQFKFSMSSPWQHQLMGKWTKWAAKDYLQPSKWCNCLLFLCTFITSLFCPSSWPKSSSLMS